MSFVGEKTAKRILNIMHQNSKLYQPIGIIPTTENIDNNIHGYNIYATYGGKPFYITVEKDIVDDFAQEENEDVTKFGNGEIDTEYSKYSCFIL